MASCKFIKFGFFCWMFQCVYTIQNNVENCGGTFFGYQFSITSPNYPASYSRNTECTYLLQGNQLTPCQPVFYLQFLDFDLEASKNCEEDYLKIGESNIFCGATEGLRKFQSENGLLKITFHAGARQRNHKGFKILVTTADCTGTRRFVVGQNVTSYDASTTKSTPALVRLFYEGKINKKLPDVTTVNPKNVFSKVEQGNNRSIRVTPYFFVPPVEKLNPAKAESFRNEKIYPEQSIGLLLPEERRKVNFKQLNALQPSLPIREAEKEPLAQILPQVNCEPNSGFISNTDYPVIDSVGGSPGLGQPSFVNEGNDIYNTGIGSATPEETNYYPNNYNPVNNGILPNNLYYPTTSPNWNNFQPNFPITPNWNSVNNVNPNTGFSTVNGGSNNYPNFNRWPSFPGNAGNSQCCNAIYSQPRFLLASPGFPNVFYTSASYNCAYHIQRSSPDVCRVRMHFKFFNLGSDDPFCSNGHVEIDGQQVCGCKTGFSITSPFINSISKIVRIRYTGFPRTKSSGFLIEVVQEPCNYNYGLRYKKEISESDAISSINGTEVLGVSGHRSKRNFGYSYPRPGTNFPQNGLSSNCQSRLLFDWALAAKEAYLRNARCIGGNHFLGQIASVALQRREDAGWKGSDYENCEIVNGVEGVLSSPGYPNNYPDNFRKCYRFQKIPGVCKLQLSILDFDVEVSSGCAKDYVLINGRNQRYCGRVLMGQKMDFVLSSSNFISLHFQSDARGSGRGFSIKFTQFLCRMSN